MKKSLVITTIATVLVIVVALTTATFAWFSSSNTTTATGTFTAQSTNAAFTFYPYKSNDTATESYDYGNGLTTLDFSTTADAEDRVDKFGVFTLSEMRGYIPVNVISATPEVIPSGNWGGLPGSKFYTGYEAGKGTGNQPIIDDAYYGALNAGEFANAGAPNMARFELSNGKEDKKELKIDVKITAQGNAQDIGMANAMRFIIIGVPYAGIVGGPENSAKPFIIGTQYEYGGLGSSDLSTNHQDIQLEATKTATATDYNDFTSEGAGYADLQGLKTISSVNGTIDYSFASAENMFIDGTKSYEIYLYIWMDGSVIKDGSKGGAVQFTINFTDPKAE